MPAKHPGIFPTFFLSGFECSTFHWKNQGRRDLLDETGHYRYADEDYRILEEHGFGVVREGVPWPFVEREGQFDFEKVRPFLEAQRRHRVVPIWDLCHYGYPEEHDPFSEAFTDAFTRYCAAFARFLVENAQGPWFFTPVNEMTFFGYMAGEWGWAAPYGQNRDDRYRLRLALARAAVAGVHALRSVLPEARMVNVDPLIHVVPPHDRPDLAEAARREEEDDAFFAWDVLYGRSHPEFGGAPEVLDIVGANVYSFGQMEYREQGPHAALNPDDPRILPLADLLRRVWQRYGRPIVIAETSGLHGGRDEWLRDAMEEALVVVREGMDFQGICLFPLIDMPDWHTGEWLHNGFCDVEGPELRRVPFPPYVEELRRWQRILHRAERLDEDPLSDPVELEDVARAAREMDHLRADRNWH